MNVSATEGVLGKAVKKVSDIFGNKGGLDRGIKKAATKASKDYKLETIKTARKAGKSGKEVKEALKNTQQIVMDNMSTANPKNLVEGIGATSGITNLINKGEKLTDSSIKAASKSATNKIKKDGAFNAVKDYYADPFKNLNNSNISDAQRKLAGQQFVGRVGATAGATALGVGVTHDLLSNNENDTGLSGITTNTAAVGGLATAGALGVSMLKKL